MTVLAALWASGFFAALLAGLVVNVQISAIALGLGLLLGLPLAQLQLGGPLQRRLAGPPVALMRAAPTFVVMFFLLSIIPPEATLLGYAVAPSGATIVALSLVPYAAAYAADNGREALRELQAGSTESALLFLPNLVRAFLVLVMSSGAGAAIGVGEGVAVVLREAERWPALDQKLVVFAMGVLCFGFVFQTGFALVGLARARLERRHRTRLAPHR